MSVCLSVHYVNLRGYTVTGNRHVMHCVERQWHRYGQHLVNIGEEIVGGRNKNATMDVGSYKAVQHKGTTKVEDLAKKVHERRMKWGQHVLRREEHYV